MNTETRKEDIIDKFLLKLIEERKQEIKEIKLNEIVHTYLYDYYICNQRLWSFKPLLNDKRFNEYYSKKGKKRLNEFNKYKDFEFNLKSKSKINLQARKIMMNIFGRNILNDFKYFH